MFQYRADVPDTIQMRGALIDPAALSIPVSAGWNWVGYVPNYALPVSVALGGLTPLNGDIIKGQTAFAQYIAGFGWLGSLQFLEPPKGYQLKISNPGTITYPANFTDPDTLELYAQGGWKWLTLKYSHAVSNIFGFANSKNSSYLDLTGSFELGHGITLTGHVGHQKIKNTADASYTDWKIGLSKEYYGLNWGLAYVDTNAKGDAGQPYRNPYGKDLGSARALLTVGKTF
jgi:hypothetical protein